MPEDETTFAPIDDVMRDLEEVVGERVFVQVSMLNVYDDETVKTTADAVVPAPTEEQWAGKLDEWASEHLQPLTGTERAGDAGYYLRIDASSNPDLLDLRFVWEG